MAMRSFVSESEPQDRPEPAQSPRGSTAPFFQAQHLTGETAQRLVAFLERSEPVKRLRGSQIISAILGSVGFALFVVGVERAAEDIPLISNAYGSILIGLILLVATGLLLRKLSGGE
jgi:hypothetical protein